MGKAGKVITVMNMKGGVGKTTVTGNLGTALAYRHANGGRRNVLLIDYDPQFNLSQGFVKANAYFALEQARQSSLAVLQDDDTSLDPYTVQLPTSNSPPSVTDLAHTIKSYSNTSLDIIVSTLDLMYVAIGQPVAKSSVFEARFAKFIQQCRSVYDVVLIDCHPAGSILTKTSLRNSDYVLIPTIPQQYAVRGIALMFRFIEAASHQSKPTPLVLLNAVPRQGTTPMEATIRGDPKVAPHCLGTTLKRYSAFTEPWTDGNWVGTNVKPYSTYAYWNLCAVADEITSRCSL